MGAYLCKDAEHAKQAKNEKSDNAMLPASEKVKNLEKEDVEVENPDIPFVDATVDEEENNELLKNDSPGKVVNDYNKCSAEKQIIEECHKLESQSPANDNITSTDDIQKVSDKQEICGDVTIEKPHVEDAEINKEISESFNIKEEATIEHNEVAEKVEETVENSIVNKAIEEHNPISEVEVPEENIEVISEPEHLSEHLNGKQGVITDENEDKNEIAECEIDIKTDIVDDRNVSVDQYESNNKDTIIPEPEILIETNLVCESQPVDDKELDNQLERHVNVCFQEILDKDSEIIDSDNQKDDNIDKNNLFDNEQRKQFESEKDDECQTEKNDIQTFIDVEKVHEHRENDVCQEKEILNQTESLNKEFVSNEDQDLGQKPIGDNELESQLDENIDCEMVEEALVEKHIDSQMKENVDEDHKQVTDLVSDETKLDENHEHISDDGKNIVSEHKENILVEVQVNNENLNVEGVHEKDEFSEKHMTEEEEQICDEACMEHLNENIIEESHEVKEQTVDENVIEDQNIVSKENEIDMDLCTEVNTNEEKVHQPIEDEDQVTESCKLNEMDIDVNTSAEIKEHVEEVQEKNITEETNSEFVKEQILEEENFNEHVEEGKQMSVETEEYAEDKHQDSTEDELIISAESSEHQDGEVISQENAKCIDEDKQHDIKEDEQISRESNEQDIEQSVEHVEEKHQDPTEEKVQISVDNNEPSHDENNDEIENFAEEFQDMIEIDKNHIEVTSALDSDNQVTKENLNENLIVDIDLNNQNISTNGNLKSDANESDDQSISNDLEIDIGVEDVKEEELIKMVSDAVDEIMGDAETQVQHIIENSASKDHSLELLES